MMYLEGVGVEANEAEGIKWLSKAAAQGLAEAMRLDQAELRVAAR